MAKRVVYVSFMLHGNMSYDRYTKQTIEESFPAVARAWMRSGRSSVPAVVDLFGHYDPRLDRVTQNSWRPPLPGRSDRHRGCQCRSLNANTDEIDVRGIRLGMDQREHLDPVRRLFCQEMSITSRSVGARQLGCRWTVLKAGLERMPVLLEGLSGDGYGFIQANLGRGRGGRTGRG